MSLPLAFQGGQLLSAVLLGACYALVYDLLRGLRRNAKWLTQLLDLCFCLILLLGNFLLALFVGKGQYRIFMLLATILGAALWFLTLSRLFLPLSRLFWRILFLPLRLLWQGCKKIRRISKKYFKKLYVLK